MILGILLTNFKVEKLAVCQCAIYANFSVSCNLCIHFEQSAKSAEATRSLAQTQPSNSPIGHNKGSEITPDPLFNFMQEIH